MSNSAVDGTHTPWALTRALRRSAGTAGRPTQRFCVPVAVGDLPAAAGHVVRAGQHPCLARSRHHPTSRAARRVGIVGHQLHDPNAEPGEHDRPPSPSRPNKHGASSLRSTTVRGSPFAAPEPSEDQRATAGQAQARRTTQPRFARSRSKSRVYHGLLSGQVERCEGHAGHGERATAAQQADDEPRGRDDDRDNRDNRDDQGAGQRSLRGQPVNSRAIVMPQAGSPVPLSLHAEGTMQWILIFGPGQQSRNTGGHRMRRYRSRARHLRRRRNPRLLAVR